MGLRDWNRGYMGHLAWKFRKSSLKERTAELSLSCNDIFFYRLAYVTLHKLFSLSEPTSSSTKLTSKDVYLEYLKNIKLKNRKKTGQRSKQILHQTIYRWCISLLRLQGQSTPDLGKGRGGGGALRQQTFTVS